MLGVNKVTSFFPCPCRAAASSCRELRPLRVALLWLHGRGGPRGTPSPGDGDVVRFLLELTPLSASPLLRPMHSSVPLGHLEQGSTTSVVGGCPQLGKHPCNLFPSSRPHCASSADHHHRGRLFPPERSHGRAACAGRSQPLPAAGRALLTPSSLSIPPLGRKVLSSEAPGFCCPWAQQDDASRPRAPRAPRGANVTKRPAGNRDAKPGTVSTAACGPRFGACHPKMSDGGWISLSPTEFAQLQQYTDCEYPTPPHASSLGQGEGFYKSC